MAVLGECFLSQHSMAGEGLAGLQKKGCFFPDLAANAASNAGSECCRAVFNPVQKRAGGKNTSTFLGLGIWPWPGEYGGDRVATVTV